MPTHTHTQEEEEDAFGRRVKSPYTVNRNRHPVSLYHSLSPHPPLFMLSACLPHALLAAAASLLPSGAVRILGITSQTRTTPTYKKMTLLTVKGKSEISRHMLL